MNEATLARDCRATLIPAGNEVTLPEGSRWVISQALGGSVTVRNETGMYRIEQSDVGALGADFETESAQSQASDPAERPFSEELIWESLKDCYDPEIPVNIVDLGLIYDLAVNPTPSGTYDVAVKMTLTAQGCGMGPAIAGDAKARIESLPEVLSAEVEIVWDPQWTPHMISPEGRRKLGLD